MHSEKHHEESVMITPIYFLNTINDAAALLLARGAPRITTNRAKPWSTSLKEAVKGQREKYAHGSRENIAHNAQTEKRLVRRDVVGGCGGIPSHKQLSGNVDEA
jgi:hypothetical protein